MRLLADENLDAAIVRWLRSLGHDVLSVAEISPAVDDRSVLDLARRDARVILTCDLDFGDLIVRHEQTAAGAVLLRLRVQSETARLHALERHWPSIEARAIGSLVVVTDDRVRFRPLHL
jgi:predicted nuclease of predicted toxin-antitoxin system